MIHNLEAEQIVLGNIIAYPNTSPLLIAKLQAECFTHPLHLIIFEAITRFNADGKTISPITIHEALKADPDYEQGYLAKLAAQPFMSSPLDYIDMLQDLRKKRLLQEVCKQAIEQTETEVSASDIVSLLDSARLECSSDIAMKNERQVMAELAEDLRQDVRPVSTGLTRLDAAMSGGFYPRMAYGFLGRKKMAKTMFASTIAKNIADSGVPVLFIAAEMGDKEIQQRVATRRMDVYANAFRSEYSKTQDFSNRFASAISDASANLIYAKAPGIAFEKLKQLITAAKIKYKIGGFILDYWQLVGGKGRLSEREHLDTVAQWLADFCRDNDLWCMVMGQENQEGNSRGGEGIRLAFDMVFSINGDSEYPERWLEMKDTRYTKWQNVGSENNPAFKIHEHGSHIVQLENEITYSCVMAN